MNRILTCNTKLEIEFHGCAADEIAGILFLLEDIRDGRILLADTRGLDRNPKTADQHGDAYALPIKQAIRILDDLATAADALGHSRG